VHREWFPASYERWRRKIGSDQSKTPRGSGRRGSVLSVTDRLESIRVGRLNVPSKKHCCLLVPRPLKVKKTRWQNRTSIHSRREIHSRTPYPTAKPMIRAITISIGGRCYAPNNVTNVPAQLRLLTSLATKEPTGPTPTRSRQPSTSHGAPPHSLEAQSSPLCLAPGRWISTPRSGRLLLPRIDGAPLNHGSPGHGKSGAGRGEFGSMTPVPPALIQLAP
jgi:hypothetical protein